MIFSVHLTWPVSDCERFERIKKLAGNDNLSKLVRELLHEWLERQEQTIENNPIGLRYSTPGTHWIDSLCELDLKTIPADLALLEDQKQVSKVFSTASTVKDAANRRSLELWKMTKEVVFKG